MTCSSSHSTNKVWKDLNFHLPAIGRIPTGEDEVRKHELHGVMQVGDEGQLWPQSRKNREEMEKTGGWVGRGSLDLSTTDSLKWL